MVPNHSKSGLPHYSLILRKSEAFETNLNNAVWSTLSKMVYLDIQKDKYLMKTPEVFMKNHSVYERVKNFCSDDTLFSGIWVGSV